MVALFLALVPVVASVLLVVDNITFETVLGVRGGAGVISKTGPKAMTLPAVLDAEGAA